jgi:hypothetical protein
MPTVVDTGEGYGPAGPLPYPMPTLLSGHCSLYYTPCRGWYWDGLLPPSYSRVHYPPP